ncbi:MAG: glycosyltransferase family 4 protein [Nitrospira sp.]|nr:glycosyltransferase family 4 protein [Nitrospira sp.]
MAKRVAIVSSSCPPLGSGGVSNAQYNLYRALKRNGYDARIFTFGDHKVSLREEDITRLGVPRWFERLIEQVTRGYFRIVEPGKLAYHVSEILSFAWPCARLRSRIRDFRPDVMVLSDHGCPGLMIGRPRGCRAILVSHHNPARFLGNPLWRLHSERDSQIAISFENRVLRHVDAVVCPSEYMRDMFRKTYEYSGPVTVIPNLVDMGLISSIPEYDIRAELGLPQDALLVYIPSAGSAYKGSRFIFEIIRRMAQHTPKQIGFYLSGSIGPELAYELRFSPSNAKIHAPGQVSYATNLATVKSCSFGISPTLVESFGMALLEANLCGVPMVSFDVGGTAEVIGHGMSGVLVPYLDLEALMEATFRLMDERYRASIRRDTLRHATENFGGNSTVMAFMQIMDGGVV